jgi:uncharacterized hydrophobic protein (TIGR00271 family)
VRFWALLIMASAIATFGLYADSVATVIGAMIVAPLMLPIMGLAFGIAIGDRRAIGSSLLVSLGGIATAIAVGYVISFIMPNVLDPTTNGQIMARTAPRLVDLLAALATGLAGAFAIGRKDVSDTLPGVAIAISLVPPLAVVGITLSVGNADLAAGALLLFVTNVTAILASGVVVMGLYRVYRTAAEVDGPPGRALSRARAATVIAILDTVARTQVQGVADDWAERAGWEVISIENREGFVVVRTVGPLPAPDPQELRRSLDEQGIADTDVRLELVPEERVELPAG